MPGNPTIPGRALAPASQSNPPPLSLPIVDSNTGLPTPAFSQFLQRLWSQVNGKDGLTQITTQLVNSITNVITQNSALFVTVNDLPDSTELLQKVVDQNTMLITEFRVLQILLAAGLQVTDDPDKIREGLLATPASNPA